MTKAAQKPAPFVDIHAECAQLPLLRGASPSIVEAFTSKAQLRTLAKGKVMFIQGDEAEWFYLIKRGWVKLFRETIDGSEAVIDVLTRGHSFGEGSLFDDGAYGYSAEVVEEAQVIAMPTSVLKTAIEEDKQIAMNMLTSMSHYRRQQSQEIEHLNLQTAPQRIGCFLLRLCPTNVSGEVKLNLPYDKTLIAARLGMKPETFSRALGKLKSETSLQVNGASVMIPDVQELMRYTCNHCSNTFPCEDLK